MACLHADLGGGTVLHVCRPDGQTVQVSKRRRRFWCFQCRKRLLHVRKGFYPNEPSYYGPHFWWECPSCQGDHRLFPGGTWEYDE